MTADPKRAGRAETVVTLPSGLRVAVEPMTSTRAVAIGAWVATGARDETEAGAGISHFLEHMMFKGTTGRTATDISRAVDRVGGDINAFTASEYTAYHARLPARHAQLGIDLIGDMLCDPLIDADDVESERNVILEEMAMDADLPEDVVARTFSAALYQDHPLGRDAAGSAESVQAITPAMLREYHRDRYDPSKIVVAVAGGVDVDETIGRIEAAFAGLPSGAPRPERTTPNPLTESVTTTIGDDTEQLHLIVGGRGIPRTDPQREALDVANHVLGGGLSSRLFDEVRERRGLAYSVYSTVTAYADCGGWSIVAGSTPQHAEALATVVETELERFIADGITSEELDVALGYLMGSFEIGLEDASAKMSRLGAQLTLLGHLRSPDEQLERWASVGLDDVNRAIENVYSGPTVCVRLGPI